MPVAVSIAAAPSLNLTLVELLVNRLLDSSAETTLHLAPSPSLADFHFATATRAHEAARELFHAFAPPHLPTRFHASGIPVTVTSLLRHGDRVALNNFTPSSSPRVRVVEADAISLQAYPRLMLALSRPRDTPLWCNGVLRALGELPSLNAAHRLYVHPAPNVEAACAQPSLAIVIAPVIDRHKLDDGVALVVGGRTPLALARNSILGLLDAAPPSPNGDDVRAALQRGDTSDAVWQKATALYDAAQAQRHPCCRAVYTRAAAPLDVGRVALVLAWAAIVLYAWRLWRASPPSAHGKTE